MVSAEGIEPSTYRLRVGESDRVFQVLARLRVNNLPTIKPARKRFVAVLKRRELAHMGSNGTAHLWHTMVGWTPLLRHVCDRHTWRATWTCFATYRFALASRRRKLSLAACTWRIFSSAFEIRPSGHRGLRDHAGRL